MPIEDEIGKRAKKRQRTTPKESGLAARIGKSRGGNRKEVDPGEIDGTALTQFVHAVLRDGCAFMLGITSDGGAYVFTLFDGEDREKVYVGANEDINEELIQLSYIFGGVE